MGIQSSKSFTVMSDQICDFLVNVMESLFIEYNMELNEYK